MLEILLDQALPGGLEPGPRLATCLCVSKARKRNGLTCGSRFGRPCRRGEMSHHHPHLDSDNSGLAPNRQCAFRAKIDLETCISLIAITIPPALVSSSV